jgi:hypothetical protein
VFFSRSTSRAPRLLKNGFPLGIFCVLHADDTKIVFGVPAAGAGTAAGIYQLLLLSIYFHEKNEERVGGAT